MTSNSMSHSVNLAGDDLSACTEFGLACNELEITAGEGVEYIRGKLGRKCDFKNTTRQHIIQKRTTLLNL